MRLSGGIAGGDALRHMPAAGKLAPHAVGRGRSRPPVLDTYKQSAQPNAHAGLRPIQEVER